MTTFLFSPWCVNEFPILDYYMFRIKAEQTNFSINFHSLYTPIWLDLAKSLQEILISLMV